MEWKRSSACATDHQTGNCVEVHWAESGGVIIRSSTNTARDIEVTADEFEAFKAGVIAGDFDRP